MTSEAIVKTLLTLFALCLQVSLRAALSPYTERVSGSTVLEKHHSAPWHCKVAGAFSHCTLPPAIRQVPFFCWMGGGGGRDMGRR